MESINFTGVALGLLATGAAYWAWKVFKPYSVIQGLRGQGIDGYKYVPFLGQMFAIRNTDDSRYPKFAQFFIASFEKFHGDVFLWTVANTVRVSTRDPEYIKEIMFQDNVTMTKPAFLRRILKTALGDGLFLSVGEKWAKHRKLISPLFHFQRLKGIVPVMNRLAGEAAQTWGDQLQDRVNGKEDGAASKVDGASNGEGVVQNGHGKEGGTGGKTVEVDLHKEMSELTLVMVGAAAFGASVASSPEEVALIRHTVDILVHGPQKRFFSLFSLFFRWVPTPQKLMEQREVNRVKKLLLTAVENRRATLIAAAEAGKVTVEEDILTMLIAEQGDEDGRGLTDLELLDEGLTFLFAGHETTAQAVTWTAIMLADHPEWQEKAREEVLRVCGPTNAPTADQLNELKVIGMLINETMRLYPPVANMARDVTKPMKMGPYVIPPGTVISAAVFAVHRNPKVWDNPDSFLPERFAEGVSKAGRHPFAFMPFGLGERNCIGSRFALMEMKIILATLLQRFNLRMAPGQELPRKMELVLTLRPKSALMILEDRTVNAS